MRRAETCWMMLAMVSVAVVAPAQDGKLDAMIEEQVPALVATYKELHAAPELSHHEEKTGAFVAGQLRALGYTVTDHAGKYKNPDWRSYGVVAVMKNGDGPTVLVRTDSTRCRLRKEPASLTRAR